MPLFNSPAIDHWVVVGNERLRAYFLDLPGGGTVVVDQDAFDGAQFEDLLAAPIIVSLTFATDRDRPRRPPTMTTAPARVLALIPGYEEGPRIGRVVEAARATCRCSSSTTARPTTRPRVAEAAGATCHPPGPEPGQGRGAARRVPLALDEGYDAVVTLDADGQHDPDEIPRFVAAFTSRASGPARS